MKSKEIELSKSNLYLIGVDLDTNGNRVVVAKFVNRKAFSIQTNGVLPRTHKILQGVKYISTISQTDLDIIELEIISYINLYGSKAQQSNLRL